MPVLEPDCLRSDSAGADANRKNKEDYQRQDFDPKDKFSDTSLFIPERVQRRTPYRDSQNSTSP